MQVKEFQCLKFYTVIDLEGLLCVR